MLATTHAHSTPETTGITCLLDAPGAGEWLEVLIEQLTSAVEMADQNLVEMSIKAELAKHGALQRTGVKAEYLLMIKGRMDILMNLLEFYFPDRRF